MFKTDRFENRLALAGLLILALVVLACANAGVKVTQEPYPQACVDEAAANLPLGTAPKTCIQTIKIEGVCDAPAPAPPPQTDAWAVQVDAVTWTTEVPGWVPASYEQNCWVMGRVPLEYDLKAKNGTEVLVSEPMPWIEGLDYPLDTPCPAASPNGCTLSPRVAP